MKTKIIMFICAVFFGCVSFAQTPAPSSFICSYYGEPVNMPLRVVNSSEDARRAIAAIMDVVGLKSNFEVKQAAIPNAAAIIYDNKRYILYNPDFISRINNISGDKWGALAILAHEIGHHLDGHTLLNTGSHPDTELEADEFSGFVLRKMGATLEQAQAALKLIPNMVATATHPAKESRLLSIDNGWSKADAQLTGSSFVAKTAVTDPAAQNTGYKAVLADNINFNVYFAADPDHRYFITKANNLVLEKDGQIIKLGSLVTSPEEDFPFAIRLGSDDYFFVTATGSVVNKNRRKIGYMKG